MRVRAVIAYRIRIPLKRPFVHARSTRAIAENIVVEVVTDRGVSGFGEGVPREYVTGETPAASLAYLSRLDYALIAAELGSVREGAERLSEWEAGAAGGEGFFPGAARCALGLGLLDALGRTWGENARTVASREAPQGAWRNRVRYSAVCAGGGRRTTAARLLLYRLYGFREVKIKVGWGKERDVALVAVARRILGPRVDIRVDANGAWDTGAALEIIPLLGTMGISSVEEPLAPECRAELPELRRQTRVPIMLDESVCDAAGALRAINEGACDMVNIRLSKCGGFFASMRLVRMLRERGIGCQLGCQVGETGILSAAGRHFACLVPGLRHIEGSYERHLLSDNIIREDITFGYGGWARAIDGPGLGVTVDRMALHRCTGEKIHIPL